MDLIIHSGLFHTDDVFSVALMRMISRITGDEIRVFKEDSFSDEVVVSGKTTYNYRGSKEFREAGDQYANFGLLWKDYGKLFLDKPQVFDDILIRYIDHNETTGEPNLLSNVIRAFNPCYDELDKVDEYFDEAIKIAEIIIKKEIEKLKSIEKIEQELLHGIVTDDILVLDHYVPYRSCIDILDKNINFIIYKNKNEKFVCKPIEGVDGKVKVPFYDGDKVKIASTLKSAIRICKTKRLEK